MMFYSFDLIDYSAMVIYAVVVIACIIALVISKKRFQTTIAKVAMTGIIFLFSALFIRSLFQIYYIDVVFYQGYDEQYLQYTIASVLFCIGAILVGLAAVWKLFKMTKASRINRKPNNPLIKHL